ncbi:MAG: hypothetical protein R3C12_04970 [Planctomycetaceae bacterium]
MNLQLEAEPGSSVSNGSLHEQLACNETQSQRGSALRTCIPGLPEFWSGRLPRCRGCPAIFA